MPNPDLRYIFVVTYGRSGSTLLMGILTVLRGLFTWLGEEFDEESVRATMGVRHSI